MCTIQRLRGMLVDSTEDLFSRAFSFLFSRDGDALGLGIASVRGCGGRLQRPKSRAQVLRCERDVVRVVKEVL